MMRRFSGRALLVVALLLAASAIGVQHASAQEGGAGELTISVSESKVSTLTGDVFTFTSEITNEGSEKTPPLIANLDFVAIDGSTYVDPEDWSGERTLSVSPIAAGGSATQTWTVKTVLEGDVAAYVAVLPAPPELTPVSVLAVSAAIQMHVEEDRKLNPGGVLPTVLAVPMLLAVAFAGLRVVRRLT
jgi:hypothetical protein